MLTYQFSSLRSTEKKGRDDAVTEGGLGGPLERSEYNCEIYPRILVVENIQL